MRPRRRPHQIPHRPHIPQPRRDGRRHWRSGGAQHLDGAMFTQRVRAATGGRRDLWSTAAIQLLLALLTLHPLPQAPAES
jgi:hypothetical protein